MYRKFGNWLLAGALAALVLSTAPAEAQRDAGAKLRGDAGRYSGRTPRATGRAFAPQPSYTVRPGYAAQPGVTAVDPGFRTVTPQPAREADEAYSVQPLPFGVGDEVTVVSDAAHLMRGRRALGTIPPGQQLRVLQIRGPWIGVATEVDGREVGGWLWYSQLAAAAPLR